jgi:hypothetical protein
MCERPFVCSCLDSGLFGSQCVYQTINCIVPVAAAITFVRRIRLLIVEEHSFDHYSIRRAETTIRIIYFNPLSLVFPRHSWSLI